MEWKSRPVGSRIRRFSAVREMPTYEYLCKKCGQRFDILQSFSDKPLKIHSDCGGDLKKVFHARGIVFKGSGFYANDHRSANSTKPAASSEAKTAAKAGSASSDD